MVFIVKKKIHGREYYYLNENKRIDSKVKTRTLAYLGKTKVGANKRAKEFMDKLKKNRIVLDRKILAELAEKNPEIFAQIIERVK